MISIGDGNLGATVFDVADSTSDASADLTVNTVLQNNGPVGGNSLTKTGAGTMELTATNTYTGSTTVSAGTLSLASSYTHSGSGAYIVNGGTLKIADGVNLGSHAMTISLGGVISPGNSPGTATVGTQNWGDGGSYLWEINNSGGFKGSDPGWDWLDITGTLDLSLLSTGGFTIDIDSLTSGNIAGDAVGFDTWTKGTQATSTTALPLPPPHQASPALTQTTSHSTQVASATLQAGTGRSDKTAKILS